VGPEGTEEKRLGWNCGTTVNRRTICPERGARRSIARCEAMSVGRGKTEKNMKHRNANSATAKTGDRASSIAMGEKSARRNEGGIVNL